MHTLFNRAAAVFCLVLAALSANAQTPKQSCSDVRTGVFKMTYENNTIIISRKDTLQTEMLMTTRDAYAYRVKWLDNCTYTLTPTADNRKKHPGLPANARMTVKITEVKPDYYLQTTSSNFSDQVLSSKVERVKQK